MHYWSLYDNKILRKFRGHSDAITDVSYCPSEDMFLTASRDRTVRLWNVQQAGCVAQLALPSNTTGSPHCVFDGTGMVFGVVAAMAGGEGNVSPAITSCVFIFVNKVFSKYRILSSIYICMMLEIFQEALFQR